jgi:hypothetical protein
METAREMSRGLVRHAALTTFQNMRRTPAARERESARDAQNEEEPVERLLLVEYRLGHVAHVASHLTMRRSKRSGSYRR